LRAQILPGAQMDREGRLRRLGAGVNPPKALRDRAHVRMSSGSWVGKPALRRLRSACVAMAPRQLLQHRQAFVRGVEIVAFPGAWGWHGPRHPGRCIHLEHAMISSAR
jgi:hypothetical protein